MFLWIIKKFGWILVLSLWLVACSHPAKIGTLSQLKQEIIAAQKKVRSNPSDFDAIRELGILYNKDRQHRKAIAALRKALALRPNDPRTICYLGLSYEFAKQIYLAMAQYEKYQNFPKESPYQKWMEGRYRLIRRTKMRQDMISLIEGKYVFPTDSSKHMIVVLPISYHGEDPKYALLRKGMTEMMIQDLGVSEQISTVERLEVQILLQEITRFSRLLKFENETVAVGRLLNAETVIRAGYNIIDDQQFVFDIAAWHVSDPDIPSTQTQVDSLKNIFPLLKHNIFEVIRETGIVLRPAEQKVIARPPTANFPAFLAYCAGLGKEDEQKFDEALLYFQKARELDPAFLWAARKIEENLALALAVKDPDHAVVSNEIANYFTLQQ